MSDPSIISGAVGSLAIIGAATTTWATLRHQRKLEGGRQGHERVMRLLDSTLTAAVGFLAAADRTTRAQQSLSTAYISLDGAKSNPDKQVYEHYRLIVEESRETTRAAIADAENAYSAIRMLIPDVAYPARRYLDFCRAADDHPDETKVDRERAREMTEQAIRDALDVGSTGNQTPELGMSRRKVAPSIPLRRGRKRLASP